METVATRFAPAPIRLRTRIDPATACAWALIVALVAYLGLDGGGYALAVHSEVGIAVWWIVVVGACFGLFPVARLSRTAWIAVGGFGAFVVWTALATAWSISTGRSLQDLSLVACYLGVLVLAVAIHRERAQAVRHTVGAVATAIVLLAALALASRFWPHLFANSQQTGQFLAGARARLSWPLDYWNALAALMALGVPLLLSLATSARTLKAQAAAAAGIPIVALCAALTLSRGGVIASAIAVIVFFALAPERFPKLATALVTGGASAALIAGAFHRSALQQGLANAAERHEATTMTMAVILVCVGVATVQAAIGLAARHGTPPRLLVVPVTRARRLLGGGVVALVAAALAVGAPHHLSHAWSDFKNPTSAISPTATSRFGSASGEGRYTYWTVAVHATRGHVLDGSGPGTYQLLWLPRAPFASYVTNAHSLYFETLSELGVVGLGLLIAFFAVLLAAGVRLVVRSSYDERTRAAAIVAALVAFMVFAGFDWIWQVPVLPAAFLLLAAALLAPRAAAWRARSDDRPVVTRTWSRRIWQAGAIVLGAASIVAILFPLATGTAITQSQTAAAAGNTPAAIADAQQAVRLEPSSAAAQLQLALTLELAHDYPAAVAAAQHAVSDESQNWSNWLILSRLEAENGNAGRALIAYRQAKALNPRSPLFQ